ncbi:MAG: DUF5916 domain-containing protein [Candidatus Eisenbacteria bacterium]
MRSVILVIAALSIASIAAAAPAPPHPPIQAVRTSTPIRVDGILDEPVWSTAPPVTRFLQTEAHEGEAATESTEVRIAFDDAALYVGARMWDGHPDSIQARLQRRDGGVSSDDIVIGIDPYHDLRSGFYFWVNAAGVQGDGLLYNDTWSDDSWDGVWEGRARIDERGWTAEMRIPFSQLRFRHGGGQVWGVNFRRDIPRRLERDYVVYQPKKENGFVSRFPELHGLEQIAPHAPLEIVPYVTAKADYHVFDDADPFRNDGSYTPDAGGDLRTSVGPLTLNATVNPDFGQVEVDPAVVNLSDVESYFPEKRPFFTENARVFGFGNEGANDYWGFNWPDPQFFYSRRVGRAPQRDVSDADYADVPIATRILGAAKLTGKIAPGFNFGTMQALTAAETGRVATGGLVTTETMEPLSYYGVVRGLREFKDRRRGLGMIGTLVARDFPDDPTLRNQLNKASLVGGIDGWTALDRRQIWVVSGYTAFSHVTGSPERMVALQTNSLHYFQRPDQQIVHVDSNATAMTGWVSRLWLNKQSGGHFLFNSAIGAIGPRFDTDDIGFQATADLINAHLGMGWAWPDARGWRKDANWIVALFESRDFEGNTINGGVWTSPNVDFINDWNTRPTFSYSPQMMSSRATRGGPAMLQPAAWSGTWHLNTDSNKRVSFVVDAFGGGQRYGSWSAGVTPAVEFKPVPYLYLSIGPEWDRNVEYAHYVDVFADPAATETYGNRYLFAHLDQTTVSGQFRLNWSFTPGLSLQTYLQPLISAGRYTDYKTLAAPRTYDFLHYPSNPTTDTPDFNFKSLRGNAVLRWEYLPGSTFYFVWTQDRSESVSNGEFDLRQNLDELTRIQPNNVFLVKVSYYLSR